MGVWVKSVVSNKAVDSFVLEQMQIECWVNKTKSYYWI